AALCALQVETLVLVPTETAARQWQRELLAHTTLHAHQVGLYAPDKALYPVTLTTYQRLASRNRRGSLPHLSRLTSHPWGLVIYDEVHVLPAPLFRLTADLQGARRLGLTATLVREDGAETDVFSLIGPKLYEVGWRELEQQGYLAAVECREVRVPLPGEERTRYERAGFRERHRLAACNPAKLAVAERLLQVHTGASVLIMGHYLEPLQTLAERIQCPLITGQTPQRQRDHWFAMFRSGQLRCLVLSRVANMAVDLPCASVAIQLSGLFGSRQEEAQRLGRLLRPESGPGVFYTLVSADTVEQVTTRHRQLYLVEQGYRYDVLDSETCLEAAEHLDEGKDGFEPVGVPRYC
ncbi:MAG: DEAD/DEAH box helicase, partial [Alicyclobacillus sp.]|nr:DEAD/DEAH box helicase [Alicyclobacillus sp.]